MADFFFRLSSARVDHPPSVLSRANCKIFSDGYSFFDGPAAPRVRSNFDKGDLSLTELQEAGQHSFNFCPAFAMNL